MKIKGLGAFLCFLDGLLDIPSDDAGPKTLKKWRRRVAFATLIAMGGWIVPPILILLFLFGLIPGLTFGGFATAGDLDSVQTSIAESRAALERRMDDNEILQLEGQLLSMVLQGCDLAETNPEAARILTGQFDAARNKYYLSLPKTSSARIRAVLENHIIIFGDENIASSGVDFVLEPIQVAPAA